MEAPNRMTAEPASASAAPRRRVLVTGGSSGIGLATVLRFAAAGDDVAVLARAEEGLRSAREQTAAAGRECRTFAVDVADREALERAVGAAVAALGGLDVAAVNAGASGYGRFRDTPPADFARVVDVTFGGAVNTIRAVLEPLERSGGSLVVTGSVASEVPLPRMAAYTAAKYALRGFVEALRVELRAARSPVAVALVEPGPVDTPFWENVASVDGLLPPDLPLAYTPEEVATAIERSLARPRPNLTVGATWAAIRFSYRLARPLGERLLAAASVAAERGAEQGPGNSAIWRPSGAGRLTHGLVRRRSLAGRARAFAARARRAAPGAGPDPLVRPGGRGREKG